MLLLKKYVNKNCMQTVQLKNLTHLFLQKILFEYDNNETIKDYNLFYLNYNVWQDSLHFRVLL